MNKSCVFLRPDNSENDIARKFNLYNLVKNSRLSIFENEQMRFSIGNKVIYVTFFDEKNEKLIEKVKNYFYGEEYENM